jgi:cell wall-associated NlpC family hydrolase
MDRRPALRFRAGLLLAPLLAGGCASLPGPPASEPLPLPEAPAAAVEFLPPQASPPSAQSLAVPGAGSDIAMRALAHVGVRYRYGGNTPETGFDCSGLVRWVFRDQSDIQLPRASRDMSLMAAPAVDAGSLVAGDLVFFRIDGRRVSHVGIYVGEGRFVHAPSRGGKVRVDRLDDRYWSRRYAGARRVLERG